MDLQKIGAFLANLRKEQSLTQEQLGEKLGVTNKTVSRWETGAYLPPAEMLLMLSELYDVSINELLCGQRLKAEEYKAAAEKTLCEVVQSGAFSLDERVAFFKRKWKKEHIAFSVFVWAMAISLFVFMCWQIHHGHVLFIAFVGLVYPIAHAILHHAMMVYVESHVFDS